MSVDEKIRLLLAKQKALRDRLDADNLRFHEISEEIHKTIRSLEEVSRSLEMLGRKNT